MQVKEFDVKYKDDDGGSIEGYASTWIRKADSYGDVVKQGAFQRTLAERWHGGKGIPLLWAHKLHDISAFIGMAEADEDEKGLHFVAKFDDTPEAQRVRQMYKDGRLSKFSFAYDVLEESAVKLDDGMRANELRELELYEISCVCIPANDDASVTDVKAAKDGKHVLETDGEEICKAIEELKHGIMHLHELCGGLGDTTGDADGGEDGSEGNAGAEDPERHNLALAILETIKKLEKEKSE